MKNQNQVTLESWRAAGEKMIEQTIKDTEQHYAKQRQDKAAARPSAYEAMITRLLDIRRNEQDGKSTVKLIEGIAAEHAALVAVAEALKSSGYISGWPKVDDALAALAAIRGGGQ